MGVAVAIGLTTIDKNGNIIVEPELGGVIDDFRSWRTSLFLLKI
jgi:hypothetical protein